MIRFYTLEEKRPKIGDTILIKINDKETPYYIVLVGENYDNTLYFTEANGEQYAYWTENEVIGWTTLNEIQKNEIWN